MNSISSAAMNINDPHRPHTAALASQASYGLSSLHHSRLGKEVLEEGEALLRTRVRDRVAAALDLRD